MTNLRIDDGIKLVSILSSDSLILIVSPTKASIFNQFHSVKEYIHSKSNCRYTVLFLTWYESDLFTKKAACIFAHREEMINSVSIIRVSKVLKIIIPIILFIRVKLLKRIYVLISPSLRHFVPPFSSRLILSGDGFGTGNNPTYNPRLSKFRVASISSQFLATSYLYQIFPAYEDYIIDPLQQQVKLTWNRRSLEYIINYFENLPSNISSFSMIIEYSNNTKRSLRILIIATSAFYESGRLSLDSEISLYLNLIKKLISKQHYAFIFVKLHPYDCEEKRSIFFSVLESNSIAYTILDSTPIEMFISKIIKFAVDDDFRVDILGFQQVLITAYLFSRSHNKCITFYSCSPRTVLNYWPEKTSENQILFFKWISQCIPLQLL